LASPWCTSARAPRAYGTQFRAALRRAAQELVSAFQQGDLAHAAEVTTQLRYVKRIQEAIVDKL
jgi:hypothetical protein